MGAESMSLWLIVLGILTVIDLVAGGKYLFTVIQFLRRLALSIVIFTVAIVAKNNADFAAYLHSSLYYATIIVAVAIIAVVLYDMIKIIIKGEELNYRRQYRREKGGSRRPTPARH